LLSKRLVTIIQDVPVDFELDRVKIQPANRPLAVEIFQSHGFKSLLSRLKELNGSPTVSETPETKTTTGTQGQQEYILIDTEKAFFDFLKKLETQPFFVFDTETTSLEPLDAKLLGVSFAWEKSKAYFVSTARLPKSLPLLKPLFSSEKIQKGGHNMKYDIRVLMTHGVSVKGAAFDTMVASYILNPGVRQHNLDRVVFEEFGYEMMPIEELVGITKKKGVSKYRNIDMSSVPVDRLSWYSCEDADFTHRLREKFSQELKTKKLEKLFSEIDMPLVAILSQMEQWGIKVDVAYLQNMSKDIHKQLTVLREKIVKLAGSDFNVNSTQQLKEILFEKLKISSGGIARGKTGLSTAASELDKLADAHPIIPLILENRELSKLASTYVDALPELINKKTGRIHSSFNQTVTATGRLSSSDPNLQNIPIRTEIGKRVRRAFIAEKGNILLSADYSQIELRIVAALSKDPKMLDAFAKGEDIHRRTAAEIWEVAPDKVTPEMRRNAKAINFGIIYGMGPMGLASGAGISREEAQHFIDKYFLVHKGIRMYLDKTKQMAHSKGYVETLFGRRRYFPEMQTQHQGLRAAAEREAVNHPIQGTAADIMKIAMKNLQSITQVQNQQWKMILQVHDELVFEIPEGDLAHSAKIIQDGMEKACDLGVPVVVDVKAGANWGEMEEVMK
ncbi:MAG TPA: DNA polymerase I, partial [Patescibacteria group bacterium]|nr:DNA polymerase I [Patescibacteria group bacterium]